jgi:glycosyltransferase involved in cell wall biosynthesis
MLNVLLLADNKPASIGGVERHCDNIMKLFFLDKRFSFSCFSKENFKHIHVKFINKQICSFVDVYVKIKKTNFDVYHIHGFASFVVFQFLFVCVLLKKKIVYTPHYHPFSYLEKPLLGRLFFFFFLKPLISKVKCIIAINNDNYLFFSKYNSNVVLIPNWLDQDVDYDSIVLSKANVEYNSLLFVGRADANKGYDHILSLPDNQFKIKCVTTTRNRKRNITYLEKITDKELSDLYLKSNVVVVPSRYEGFSYVVLEALFHGTPVLLSDRVHIIDFISKKIEAIEIFKYGDYNDFQFKLKKMLAANIVMDKVDFEMIKFIFDKEKIKAVLITVYMN